MLTPWNQNCIFYSPEDSREGTDSASFPQTFHQHLLEQYMNKYVLKCTQFQSITGHYKMTA